MAYTPSVRLAGNVDGGDRMLNGIDVTYRYQPLDSVVYQGLTIGSEFFQQQRTLCLRRCGQTPAILRRLQLR